MKLLLLYRILDVQERKTTEFIFNKINDHNIINQIRLRVRDPILNQIWWRLKGVIGNELITINKDNK